MHIYMHKFLYYVVAPYSLVSLCIYDILYSVVSYIKISRDFLPKFLSLYIVVVFTLPQFYFTARFFFVDKGFLSML